MGPYRGFDYRIEGGVGTVTFARPGELNALTFEVYPAGSGSRRSGSGTTSIR
jgi:enoyl-CoA hydratase/carnithine racemase